jgi:hypothetical protein
MQYLLALFAGGFFAAVAVAQPPAAQQQLDDAVLLLKPLLLSVMPNPLFEHNDNWGRTTRVPHAVRWKGLKPTVVNTDRNDGLWRKLRVLPARLPHSLDLRLWDLRRIDADRQGFKGALAFDVEFEIEQQLWESGLRLWAGDIRGRMRVQLDMDLEQTLKFETGKSAAPDLVYRLRITNANLTYRHFVVTHIPGIGGTAAKLTGEAAHAMLKQWRPSIERKLLERANTAIVKAADTKEIRVGLGGIQARKP